MNDISYQHNCRSGETKISCRFNRSICFLFVIVVFTFSSSGSEAGLKIHYIQHAEVAPTFDAVTSQVPLHEMNPTPKQIAVAQLREDGIIPSKLPLDKEDQRLEDMFNRNLCCE